MAGSRTSAYIAALQRKYERQMQPRVAQTPAFTFPSDSQQMVTEPVNSQPELTGFDRFAAGAMDTALGAFGRAAAHIPGVNAVLPDAEKNKEIIASGLQTPLAQNVMDALATPLYGVMGAGRNVVDTASAAINPSRATSRQRGVLNNVENALGEGDIGALLNAFNPVSQAAQVWGTPNNLEDEDNPRVTGADLIDSLAAREGPSENTINIAGLDTHIGYDWLRGGGGFALDVLLDPLSYVSGAGALKLGRVASMTARGGGAARAAGTKVAGDTAKEVAQNFANDFKTNWQTTGSARRFTKNPDGTKTRNRVRDAGRIQNWDFDRLATPENPRTNLPEDYVSQLSKWSDDQLEIARQIDETPEIAPKVETPSKPIIPSAANVTKVDDLLDEIPEGTELGAADSVIREATKVTQAKPAIDRSAIEIESPFIKQLLEETTPAEVAAPVEGKPWGQFLNDSVEQLNKTERGKKLPAGLTREELGSLTPDEWADEIINMPVLIPGLKTGPWKEVAAQLNALKKEGKLTPEIKTLADQHAKWQRQAREIISKQDVGVSHGPVDSPGVVKVIQEAIESHRRHIEAGNDPNGYHARSLAQHQARLEAADGAQEALTPSSALPEPGAVGGRETGSQTPSRGTSGRHPATGQTPSERKRWLEQIRRKYVKPKGAENIEGTLTPEEYASLRDAKTEEEFFNALARIKNEVPSPIIEPAILEPDVPAAPPNKLPAEVSAERVIDTDGSDLTPIRDAALKHLYDTNLSEKYVRENFPHKTKKGVPRTHKTPGVGKARHREYVNSEAQVETYDFIWSTVRKQLTDNGIKGLKQDVAAARMVTRISKSVDEYIRSVGGTPFVGRARSGFALGMSDIMPALMRNPDLAAVLTTVDMRASSAQIVDAVEAMLKMTDNATPEGRYGIVKDILERDVKKSPTGSGRNSLIEPSPTGIGTRQRYVEATGAKPPKGLLKNLTVKEVKTWLDEVVPQNVENLARTIANSFDEFNAAQIANRKRYRADTGSKSFKLTEQQIARIEQARFDPSKTNTELVEAVTKVQDNILDDADEIGANAEAVEIAQVMTPEAVTEVVSPAEMAKIEHQITQVNNIGTNRTSAENIRYAKQVLAARQLFRSKEGLQDFDLFMDDVHSVVLDQFGWKIPKTNSYGLGKVAGMADIMPATKTNVQDIATEAWNLHNRVANKWNLEKSPVNQDLTMFDDISRVMFGRSTEPLANFPEEAVKEIQELYNYFVGLNSRSLQSGLLDNRALTSGANFERLSDINDVRDVGFRFDIDRAKVRAAIGDEAFEAKMAEVRTKLGKRKSNQGKKITNQDVFAAMAKTDEWKAAVKSDISQADIKTALGNQWKEAEIPTRKFGTDHKGQADYAQFLHNNLTAQLDSLTEVAAATSFQLMAERHGLISKVAKPGFVKLSARSTDGKLTALGANLPAGQYYHPDIVPELMKIENLIRDVYRAPNGLSNWISKWVMPFLDTWKTGMTIYRPGHHVRNAIGDLSLSQLAGRLRNPKYFRMAHRVNQLNGGTKFKADAIAEKQAQDAARSLQYIKTGIHEAYESPKGRPILEIRLKGGTPIKLTDDVIYEAQKNRGILQQSHIRENLMQEIDVASQSGAQRREKIRQKLSFTGGRVRRVAVKGGEVRDHTIRMAHFIEFVEREARHYTNVRDLFDDAANEVRKFHPDGSGMTVFENRVLRPLIPFYSWTRKAIPIVAEAALVNPARFMLLPKAMYAIAATQGIDLEGFGNPFPQDQMFPSFLRERALGPTFGEAGAYIGVNPGFAHVDVLNQFSGAPAAEGLAGNGLLQGVASSLNPAIRIAPEFLSGTNMSTGAPVSDWSDYVDMQIPGLNILNSAGGVSASGILGADMWLGGDDYSALSRNVERGLKQPVLNPATLNLLLGLGITDMSQPNYINLAEIEQRNGRVY